MFLHNLKYETIAILKSKDVIIWVMLFPILLGTFFKIAFGDIYEKDTLFSTIQVAVVENSESETFRTVLEEMENSEEPLLKAEFCDEAEAEELLKNGDVNGIIYSGERLSLSVGETGMKSTILASFIEQYNSRISVIEKAAENEPTALREILAAFSEETDSVNEIPLTDGNTDVFLSYFYNLIAMVALYGSMVGMKTTINNQANLSSLGMRKGCSPVPKSISLLASITAAFIVQTISMAECVTFLAFVLKVDFGSRLPLVYFSAILGGLYGISFGFLLGANRCSEQLKQSISISISMLCCFLSGLMVGDMKIKVEEKAPWFNRINPAAVISDTFYCLNVYSDYDRFLSKIVSMAVGTVIFFTFGFIVTRRKKYASL